MNNIGGFATTKSTTWEQSALRYESAMRHLAIGRAHKGKYVIILIVGPEVMIADVITGELLAEHTIGPDKSYQPRK